MRRLTIDPITRLEGHGRIEIFLDERGDVRDVAFQVPELRGFERLVVGRPAEDMPALTSRICGICPEAHHLAAVKALDALFGVAPPPAARNLRELLHMAFFASDHATHFYALGGPDLLVGPDAPPAERNLPGVVKRLGGDAGARFVAFRKRCHRVLELLGGRVTHGAGGVPGGWSRPLTGSELREVEGLARENLDFARFTLALFNRKVWDEPALRDLFFAEAFVHRTHSMGTVDWEGNLALYDGDIRVVDPDGGEVARYPCRDYALHVAERVEPWTYLKVPYLRRFGWKGYVDGPESGVYTATPLARLNAARGLATPLAREEGERFFEAMGAKPVHHRMATHWARLVELLYAAERMLELAQDPQTASPDVRRLPPGGVDPAGGVGSVEAPRGTLIHHYEADAAGRVTRANLIVGTTNNHAAIAMSLLAAARSFIRGGEVVEEGALNRVEMAFRLYDPCLSCATHALGRMPLSVTLRRPGGDVLRVLARD